MRNKIIFQLGIPLVVMLLFMGVVLYFSVLFQYQNNKSTAEQIPYQLAIKIETQVSGLLGTIQSDLLLASKHIATSDKNNPFLNEIINNNSSILELYAYDKSGEFIKNIQGSTFETEKKLKNVSSENFFIQSISGSEFISSPYQSSFGVPFLFWSLPIYDARDQVIGLMVATIDLSSLWGIIAGVPDGQAYVVDKNGQLLVSQNLLEPPSQELINSFQGVQNFVEKEQQLSRYQGIDNENVISTWREIPLSSWGVVVEISQKSVYKNLQISLTVSGILIFSFVLYLIIALFLLHKKVLSPLTELTQGVLRISDGELDTTLYHNLKNEIGNLANSFTVMTSKLKDSLKNLEKKVEERTKELEISVQMSKKRNAELENSRSATLNILEDLDSEKKIIEKTVTERTYELTQEKWKLGVVTERMVASAILIDTHGQVQFVNGALLRLLAIDSFEPLIIMPTLFEKFSDPEIKKTIMRCALDRISDEINEVDLHGRVYTFMIRNIEVDYHNQSNINGTVIFIHDITDEKLLERSKSELVAIASHQLRTPLTSMRGNVEMLVDESYGALNKKQKELLDDVEVSTVRLIMMVNDMLDITKIEGKILDLNLSDVAIAPVVDSIISDLSEYAQRQQFTISHNRLEENVTVYVDKLRVRQVLQNLMDNAIKYSSHPGSLSVSYAVDDSSLIMKLADDGIGIPQAEQAKLFGRFYRASNTAMVPGSGSGLGLYIVKSIVESFGGSISFESVEDEGTTFIVRLPRQKVSDLPDRES
ncbi:MAG: signal transduction histidine kinase [Acidimicrobiales bacterium]|jgi:signal transduction histidine kinase